MMTRNSIEAFATLAWMTRRSLLPALLLSSAAFLTACCIPSTGGEGTSEKNPKQVAPASGSSTYTNARFGFAIDYPSELLVPQGESDNGDGQKFVSKDGKATLTSWGSFNVLGPDGGPQAVQQLFAEACQGEGRTVTYKVQKENWFVVSGIVEGKVFYQKTFVIQDATVSFLLEYDQATKSVWDPMVGTIAKSFRPTTKPS